jgi:hypothetical protein
MRNAAVKQRISRTFSVPSPTKGWNTLDSIAQMDSKYAVILQNFMPTSSSVNLRKGSQLWATGMNGRVETVASWNGANVSKLFAAVDGKIYDVTSSGTVGAAVVSGLSSNRWQHVNFATPGGRYLLMVNGVDSPRLFDGTTWTAITGVSTPAITGVTSSNLDNVTVFQNKLWFVEKNTLKVWYLSSASIGGAANVLNLSSLFPRGGYLVAMGDWTIDSGSGIDDLAVFITSEGEVAVYRGTDPSSAATFALVGIYQIGSPIGKRCLCKFASDLLILNQDGLQLMSSALSSSRVTLTSSVTDKIQPSISQAINTYGDNFGWETTLFSPQDAIFMNIPITGGSQQYLMNTRTKGWCNLTGWDAACFEVMNDELYFGTTNAVYKAFTGNSDNGIAIPGEALQAFSYMGTSNIKYFQMARPIIATDASTLGLLLGFNIDFDITPPSGTPTFSGSGSGTWDNAIWDTGTWGGALTIRKDWQTIGGVGYTGALHMKTLSVGANIEWSGTNYTYQAGSGFV